MTDRIRVGILFGGRSREREVSFAGGRTVYDSIDKELYEPIPIFVDGHNTLIKLNWQYLYRGTIRDFYPSKEMRPNDLKNIRIYDDSIKNIDYSQLGDIGTVIRIENLKNIVDVIFLILHGLDGEDGNIQGMLNFLDIPYTGSGILGSAIGIDKVFQKEIMKQYGYEVNECTIITSEDWNTKRNKIMEDVLSKYHVPFIIKSSSQGSSIGVSRVDNVDKHVISDVINKSFGQLVVHGNSWNKMSYQQKEQLVFDQIDYRYGIGYPVIIDDLIIYSPLELINRIDGHLHNNDECVISSSQRCNHVIVEEFIEGREFSCVVVQDHGYNPVAFPPTEIIKSDGIFDYRSKYLPGATVKQTPMNVDKITLEKIRETSVQVFKDLHFNVYARIDGFLTKENEIIINDPNTIAGMEPSSFIFQQAAEIGLTPTDLITFILTNATKPSQKLIK